MKDPPTQELPPLIRRYGTFVPLPFHFIWMWDSLYFWKTILVIATLPIAFKLITTAVEEFFTMLIAWRKAFHDFTDKWNAISRSRSLEIPPPRKLLFARQPKLPLNPPIRFTDTVILTNDPKTAPAKMARNPGTSTTASRSNLQDFS